MKVTIIDHHIIPDSNFIHRPGLKIVMGYDQDNYFENVKPYIDYDFDFVFYDENPDAMIAASIYLIDRDKPPQNNCISRELKSPDFQKLGSAGKNNIVIFNTLRSYYSDFDRVDEVILINPHETGLQNISVSHIVYKAVEKPTALMRDLTGIAVVMDYTLEEAIEIIVEIVKSNPDLFADVTERIKNITLNKYNIHDSVFGELTALFRAPSILNGAKGVETVIYQLLMNPEFSLADLLKGEGNKAIEFLQKCSAEYKKILAKEIDLFESEKLIRGLTIIYTPHYQSENFIREFSNVIKDRNIDSIIMMKVPVKNNRFKYSIRRGELEIDLGGILEEMGVGGGNPFAAGCTVKNPDYFEIAFLKKVEEVGLGV